jgi:hypothetical protein
MFDEKLNMSALGTMKWAPFFMMIFGYWTMGNRQIFDNVVIANEYKTDPVQTDHKGYNIAVDQALPLFVMAAFMFVFIFFNDLFLTILQRLHLAKVDQEAEVDEKLGTFTQCLGPKKRKIWRIEEYHMRNELGIRTLSDKMLEDLKFSGYHNKMIKTCPSYEITSNNKYAAALQYTQVDMRDTPEEKINSDMVAKMIYLAYFSDHQSNSLIMPIN